MKKQALLSLAIVLLLSVLLPSCAPIAPIAVTPECESFSRQDWEACGLEPWSGSEEIKTALNGQQGLFWDGEGACGSSLEFDGGKVDFSSEWLTGSQYKRLNTKAWFSIDVTDVSAGVALPRGLQMGCTFKDVENAFGLGETNDKGLYYGDGKNAPYASKDGGRLTLAALAGEGGDARFNYVCRLIFIADSTDKVTEFIYASEQRYRILPGISEPQETQQVRLYSAGNSGPDRKLDFEEAVDLLACLQDAGQTPVQKEVTPTNTIEIIAGRQTYELQYGGGLVKTPDGDVYEIWDMDKEVFYHSAPGLLAFDGVVMRDNSTGKTAQLTEWRIKAVNVILGGMTPSEHAVPQGDTCRISAQWKDGEYVFTYYIGTDYVVFNYKEPVYMTGLFSLNRDGSQQLKQLYDEAFSEDVASPGSESTPEQGSPAPVLNEEPLLPGLPSPDEITEVRIWRIGKEGMVVIFTPLEAEELLELIHAGSDKPIKGKLESPTHKIILKTSKGRFELTVGSNGIQTPKKKLYDVEFTDHAIGYYLFL